MARLAIRLFGSPGLAIDGEPWPLRAPPRCWPLLAYLTLCAEPVTRASAAAALWPDLADGAARANLRRHLHQLRRALPAGDEVAWLIDERGRIGWNHTTPAEVDAATFVRTVDDPATRAEAVERYAGELLADYDDEWLVVARERLRARYGAALLALARARRGSRDFGAARVYAERLLALDEVHEDAVRELMIAHYETGERGLALAAFERFATRLRSALDVEPDAETLALAATIRARAPLGADDGDDAVAKPVGWVPVLAGRDAELETLKGAWGRAARGSGTFVVVDGEAGIGKTRLVGELAAFVRTRGGRVVVGATADPETEPFGALLAALRRVVRLAGALGAQPATLAALAPVLPEVLVFADGPVDADGPAGESGRARLLEALCRCVEAVAAARPLVLVLEDLHWAGAATVDALGELARNVARLPVLLIATYRGDEAGPAHPMRRLYAQLAGQRRVTTLALRRLTADAVARMLAWPALADAPPTLVPTIHRVSDGNPLFVAHLARGFVETGALPEVSPPGIDRAIADRIARLAAPARAVGEVAAAIGDGFTLDVVRETGGWETTWVLDALSELMDAGMVREAGVPGFDYAFTHALVTAAMDASATAPAQRARHRRLARIFARDRSDRAALETIARHWRLAGDDVRASAAYARAAQGALEIFGRSEAVAFAHLAHDLAGDDAARYAALRIAAAAPARASDAAGWEGDVERLEAVAARLGDAERFVALALREALCWQLGRRPEQRAAIAAMLALAERLDDVARADAHDAHGISLLADGDMPGARNAFRASLAAAERARRDAPIARARQHLIQSLIRLGERAEASALLEVARAMLARGSTFDQQLGLTRAEGALAIESEDPVLAQRAGHAMLELAERAADVDATGKAHALFAIAAHLVGDVAAARVHYRDSFAAFERCQQAQQCTVTTVNCGILEVDVGNIDAALAYFAQSRADSEAGDWKVPLAYTLLGTIDCCIYGEDPERAAVSVREAETVARATGDRRLVGAVSIAAGTVTAATSDRRAGLEKMLAGADALRTSRAQRSLADALALVVELALELSEIACAATAATELRGLAATLAVWRHPARIGWALAAEARVRGDAAAHATALRDGARLYADRLARAGADGVTYAGLGFNRRWTADGSVALPR